MTKPHADTPQLRHFLLDLNQAIPLELMIRAARLACPQKLEELRGIDAAMRNAWQARGFTAEEVEHNGLADRCWDSMQLGWSERRSLFERWPLDVIEMIEDGTEPICQLYRDRVKLEDYPFARRHRYADLLRGINVGRVLREYLKKENELLQAPDADGVPFSKFIHSFRAPVPVVPGARQQIRCSDGSEPSEYLGLMLRYDMPLKDVRAALRDFEYHYAAFRLGEHNLSDDTAHRLLDRWGSPSMPSKDELINQFNQVRPTLAGLHLYDRFVAHGGEGTRGARSRAVKDLKAQYPDGRQPDENLAGKWLDTTREEIEGLAEELRVLCRP